MSYQVVFKNRKENFENFVGADIKFPVKLEFGSNHRFQSFNLNRFH